MSYTPLADVRALVIADLSDADLQAVIDREEVWLTSRVGAPSGERTDLMPGGGPVIVLGRPIQGVTSVRTDIADAAGSTTTLVEGTDYRVFYAQGVIERRTSGRLGLNWQNEVLVQWVPVDFTADYQQCVIDLVRLTLSRRAFASEQVGSEWRYSAPADGWEAARDDVLARLTRPGVFA